MGAYDELEMCELVGLFGLHEFSSKFNKSDIDLPRQWTCLFLKY